MNANELAVAISGHVDQVGGGTLCAAKQLNSAYLWVSTFGPDKAYEVWSDQNLLTYVAAFDTAEEVEQWFTAIRRADGVVYLYGVNNPDQTAVAIDREILRNIQDNETDVLVGLGLPLWRHVELEDLTSPVAVDASKALGWTPTTDGNQTTYTKH